ncbi:MAG: hypothetical protein LBG06_01290 [Deltaproteobacteria bacterium]|jgi:hypothetical protein|nr:hypothetical protein [Deltaproteobacteria bacterium]
MGWVDCVILALAMLGALTFAAEALQVFWRAVCALRGLFGRRDIEWRREWDGPEGGGR